MTRARDLADSADKDIAGTLIVDSFEASSKSTITVDGNTAALELISTDTDNSEGPQFQLIRDSNSPAINDWLGVIKFRGKNNADQSTNFFEIGSRSYNVADGNETGYLRFLQTVGGTQHNVFTLNDTAAVFNEDALNKDFRVESTSNQNMLFVDGGTNKVGIGTGGVLQSTLHVFSGDSGASVNSAANELFVEDSGDSGITIGSGNASSGSLRFADDGGTGRGIVYYDHSTDALSLFAGGLERFKVDATGATVTSGTLTATALNLTSATDLTLSSTPALVIGPADGANIAMDRNEISARNDGAGAELLLNQDAGQGAVRVNSTLYLTGSSVSTTSSTLDISVDSDASGSNQQIRFLEGGVVRMVMEDNDLYVSDNISAGRKYESGATNVAFDTVASHVSAYAADTADGSGNEYRTFIQAYNSTDPDVAVFQAFSKDVMADTGSFAHDQKATAHLLDNGGRAWSWNTVYAGRVRIGNTATTTAYRAADNGFTAYSGTGNAHGHTTYAGYTYMYGRESANGDDVFHVNAGGQARIEFDAIGNGYFDGGADLGNADYAEYFEWADGNPNNEDRRGYSVVLTTDGKMRIATSEDDTADFLGIVSVEAAVVGDSAWAAWTGKCERDRFGQKVYEDYELLCWGPYDEESKSYKTQTTRQAMIDAGREADIPDDAIAVVKQRQKLAADYDPDREYIPRKDRQEWQAIGLMGKLPLLKGQPTAPQWRKLFDLNEEVEMWLVR